MRVGVVLAAVLAAALLPLSLSLDKGAVVTLAARWQGTSYLLEAAELMVRSVRVQYVAERPFRCWHPVC